MCLFVLGMKMNIKRKGIEERKRVSGRGEGSSIATSGGGLEE